VESVGYELRIVSSRGDQNEGTVTDETILNRNLIEIPRKQDVSLLNDACSKGISLPIREISLSILNLWEFQRKQRVRRPRTDEMISKDCWAFH
jgi:hypothetical protein